MASGESTGAEGHESGRRRSYCERAGKISYASRPRYALEAERARVTEAERESRREAKRRGGPVETAEPEEQAAKTRNTRGTRASEGAGAGALSIRDERERSKIEREQSRKAKL
ncbi:hypothetical protein WJX73_002292 [Symbiochloris irregularis]|uniref:Uncharacterized protein n=1 Tax=Symbiochloris irregularis TaxID=706552 RepID=A0AAW1PZ05_9CHLO